MRFIAIHPKTRQRKGSVLCTAQRLGPGKRSATLGREQHRAARACAPIPQDREDRGEMGAPPGGRRGAGNRTAPQVEIESR